MNLRNLLLGGIGTFLLGFVAWAQQAPSAPESPASIEIGGMILRLGMAQDFVIRGLSDHYSLHEIGTSSSTGSSWVAETKAGPPYTAVANLSFVGGELSSVYKFWTVGNEPHADAGFVTTLYRAVERFKQETKTPCELTTNRSGQPVGESKAMVVTCGGRQKSLSINIVPTGNGQDAVSLSEVLKYPSDEVMLPDETPGTTSSANISSSSPTSPESEHARVEEIDAKSFTSPRILRTKADSWAPPDVYQDTPAVTPGTACALTTVLSKAGKRVQELVKNVDKFTATEVVEHQSVDKSGQLHAAEIRKFNYLVSIAQSPSGRMNVEEYRNGGSDPQQFPDHIATVGTPSLILVFHPQHANDFRMACEGLGGEGRRPGKCDSKSAPTPSIR